jgi:hypothetical protein
MSMRPGITVLALRSTSRAPAGAGVSPAATAVIRPSVTVIVEGAGSRSRRIGDQPPGMDDYRLGRGGSGGEEAQ